MVRNRYLPETLLEGHKKRGRRRRGGSGQSYVEFGLMAPILLLMILGVVELAAFVYQYMYLVELTRESARFASIRDPFDPASNGDLNCSTTGSFNFFYDTSCIFAPTDVKDCTDSNFCGGFNALAPLKSDLDDVLVTVFTVTDDDISAQDPPGGPWVWSDNDADTAHNDNWETNCGTPFATPPDPYFTPDRVKEYFQSGSITNKGFVTVEVYFCYYQLLASPILKDYIPNPVRLHAYTIMPLPAAFPTSTPPAP